MDLKKILTTVATVFSVSYAHAAPELQVMFHMGMVNGSTKEVVGTLANIGDVPIAQGYLVITPIANHCNPKSSILYSFGTLVAGEEQQFRVSVTERFSSYRLQMGAFDEQGFVVASHDANQSILDGRIREERDKCNGAREDLSHKDIN